MILHALPSPPPPKKKKHNSINLNEIKHVHLHCSFPYLSKPPTPQTRDDHGSVSNQLYANYALGKDVMAMKVRDG